jgi:hypothetical protein
MILISMHSDKDLLKIYIFAAEFVATAWCSVEAKTTSARASRWHIDNDQ